MAITVFNLTHRSGLPLVSHTLVRGVLHQDQNTSFHSGLGFCENVSSLLHKSVLSAGAGSSLSRLSKLSFCVPGRMMPTAKDGRLPEVERRYSVS